MSFTHGALVYLINHLFLPPKLPGGSDVNSDHDTFLLEMTINSLRSLKSLVQSDQAVSVQQIIDMLFNLRDIRDARGNVDEEKLVKILKSLGKTGKHIFVELLQFELIF